MKFTDMIRMLYLLRFAFLHFGLAIAAVIAIAVVIVHPDVSPALAIMLLCMTTGQSLLRSAAAAMCASHDAQKRAPRYYEDGA